MDISLVLFVLFLFEHPVNCVLKTWKIDQEPSGNNALVRSSCENSKVVFDKEPVGVFNMENRKEIEEIVLPKDGAVIMLPNSQVQFTNASKCELVPFLEPRTSSWFSPRSWKTDGEAENEAKPHIFSIPCECDVVLFPGEAHSSYVYAVDLELVDEIVADQILINDHTGNFDQFLETPMGQKMFLNSEAVHFTPGICHPPRYCGCHNQERFYKYTELLCEEESKHCKDPHCLEPIQPEGHCCPICGAILNFKTDDTCSFNITNMNEVGRKLRRFRNGKYLNKLHYYSGMVPGKSIKEDIVQLVIAEVGEYTGISVEFMDYLTKDEHFRVDAYRHKITSGDPYIRGQTYAFLIMFLTLLFVLSIFTVIYVHYEKEPKYENWVPISRLNMLRRSIAFARFENRRNDEGNDTIDVGVRYEDDEQSDEKSLNGFNNPMYERERHREAVTLGSVETEMLQPTTSTAEEVGDIKLVDINLDAIGK